MQRNIHTLACPCLRVHCWVSWYQLGPFPGPGASYEVPQGRMAFLAAAAPSPPGASSCTPSVSAPGGNAACRCECEFRWEPGMLRSTRINSHINSKQNKVFYIQCVCSDDRLSEGWPLLIMWLVFMTDTVIILRQHYKTHHSSTVSHLRLHLPSFLSGSLRYHTCLMQANIHLFLRHKKYICWSNKPVPSKRFLFSTAQAFLYITPETHPLTCSYFSFVFILSIFNVIINTINR